ncbi:MAG TPA: peptide ABC transporter substrate-binding protein [Dehalococcoidia bacterium]|nr:peptide ABC transporter substrate-binding protein [Dehalococcoidia bacterium]
MKKVRQLTLLGVLLCALATLPLTGSCQLEETPLPLSPPAREQGVLNLWDTGPMTLDPAISSELTSHTYVMQIFSGLVCLDTELKPAPDIAESWQRSNDGKTYTFYLRQGVSFHNGREVTAQDFKYSWERACNPETYSQTAATYLGDIVGVDDVLKGKAIEIRGVEVIDDYTLKVTIDAPKAYFLAKLTYPTAFAVDKANVESAKEWWRKPNGTGPFKLKEWKPGEVLVLEPNELHYQEPAKINQVVFHLLGGMPVAMYEMGEIDVAPVYQDYIDRARDENGPFYKELAIFPELSLFYIGFNTQKPPFDDVNIRRAFCHAVNKQRIIELTLKGMMTKADGILPPGMPGYNENLRQLDYDIAKAKSLIASSKYGSIDNLPPVTITVSGWGGYITEYLGAIIQDWQHNLGVEVTARQLEPEIFSYYLREEVDEIFILGWIADYPDPQNFLDNLFHTGAEYNTGNYTNPELDALLDQAAVEPDNTTRLILYQQAEQKLIDEAACLPLWFGTNYVLVKPYVKNYKPNALSIPALSQVYIEESIYSSP